MSRIPMPDAPNRRTAQQMIRAAQMTDTDPAAVMAYLCLVVTKTGDVEMAGNIHESQLGAVLRSMLEQLEAGEITRADPEGRPPERPELN